MPRILIIDDDDAFLRLCAIYLQGKGHQVHTSTRPEEAVELVRRFQPDAVVIDLLMPGVMGGGVYQALRRDCGPGLPIIVCSGMKLKLSAKDDPKLSYCPKPADPERLAEVIAAALNS